MRRWALLSLFPLLSLFVFGRRNDVGAEGLFSNPVFDRQVRNSPEMRYVVGHHG